MDDLARTWLEAARDATIAAELERVYELVRAETAAQRPTCVASGRCCNFARTGHLLYVTGLEAAYTVARLNSPGGANAGAVVAAGRDGDDRVVTLAQVDRARMRGDCPFLNGTACSVHEIKPLGCRVYFCDWASRAWQNDLSERALALIREVHERHQIPYRYGEWRAMLEAVVASVAT